MTYVSPVSGNDPTRYIPQTNTSTNTTGSTNTTSTSGSQQTNGTNNSGTQSGGNPQQATDQAVANAKSAQAAVNNAQAAANNPHGTPASVSQAKASLPSLEKKLTDAQQQLQTAVSNEITAKVGPHATQQQIAQAGQQIISRYANDPTAQKLVSDAVTQVHVHSIVSGAAQNPDPVKALQQLSDAYTQASQPVRDALLKDPGAQKIISNAAQWATQPLNTQPGAGGQGYQAPGAQTMQRLNQLTASVDPSIGAQVVTAAMPAIQSYNHLVQQQTGMSMLGPTGVTSMLKVLDNIGATAAGQAAMKQFATMGFWNTTAVMNAIGNGASPAYAIAYAEQNPGVADVALQAAMDGVSLYEQKVNGAVGDFAAQNQELSWLIANVGPTMTPAQLQKAIQAYGASKGAAWQKQVQDLYNKQLPQMGLNLLNQLMTLRQLPAGLQSYQGKVDSFINGVMNNPQANFAITLGLQHAIGQQGANASMTFLNNVFTTMKGIDTFRKLATGVLTWWVQQKIVPDLQRLDPNNPATYAQVKQDLENLKLSKLPMVLGVTHDDFNTAIQHVEDALPVAGDDPNVIAAKLNKLDQKLDGMKSSLGVKSFAKGTMMGQLLRGIAVVAAIAGIVNDGIKVHDKGNIQNILKVGVDVLGLAQKGADFAASLGPGGKLATRWPALNNAVNGLSGDWKIAGRIGASEIIQGLGAIFDGWNAINAFQKGDYVSGGLYTASALGGAATAGASGLEGVLDAAGATALGDFAGAWLGPIGVAAMLVSVVGLYIWGQHEAVTQYETAATQKFLEGAGIKPTQAQALIQQSGNGYSPVPLLARYAQLHGLDLQNPADQQRFVKWINSLSADQLQQIVTAANATQDANGGDVSKFGLTSSQDNVPFQQSYQTRSGTSTRTNIHLESARLMDKLLQYLHAPAL